MPSGRTWIKFWETSKSVKEVRPLISSGRHSNLFSETSRQSRFFRFPTSCDTRWNVSRVQTCSKAIWEMYDHHEIPERKAILCVTSKSWKKEVGKFSVITQLRDSVGVSCSKYYYWPQQPDKACEAHPGKHQPKLEFSSSEDCKVVFSELQIIKLRIIKVCPSQLTLGKFGLVSPGWYSNMPWHLGISYLHISPLQRM